VKTILANCAVLLLLIHPAGAKEDDRPNIVFIMADDLGYGHLGCYGQKIIRTPHLDRLAADGIRFTDVYAGSCVCAPSRSVLMTGMHGGHTPVRGNTGGIPLADEDVTVGEILHTAGYVTGLFGKWGLGEFGTSGVPNRQGFDQFFGYLHQIHAHFYYPHHLWNNAQRYELPGNFEGRREQYTHDLIVSRAMDFIRTHRDDRFFLYVPFAVPHYELLVPESSLKEYEGRFEETPYTGRGRKTGYPSDYAQQKMPRAATAAIISHMDDSVGKIMSLLRELQLEEDTLVLFTSDNGAASGPSDPDFFNACGPLRGCKGTLWEGGIRVPMIVRWTGIVPSGRQSSHAWYFADVLPTLADVAGAPCPEEIDGVSVLPALRGQGPRRIHETMYWEHEGARAARAGPWKAVQQQAPDGRVELYDLASDPGETTDVGPQHPDVLADLQRTLVTAHEEPRPQIEPTRPPGRQFQ